MTFEIEVAGRLRTVVVDAGDRAGRFRVTLDDGQPHDVDAARLGEHGLSILRTVACGGRTVARSSEVHVVPAGAPGELMVLLEGRTAIVTLNGRRRRGAGPAADQGDGEATITAPMPGRVVRVLVAEGDDVAPRQGVVVVEAMKMENELQAPRAGRVKQIAVAPGMSVDAGRILAVIE